MKTQYQLILIGDKHALSKNIVDRFVTRVVDLGLKKDAVNVIDETSFATYKSNAPTVCLYFGASTLSFPNIDILEVLIRDAAFILPVVSDVTNFPNLVPDLLTPINGFELKSDVEIESLVSILLEGLSLLRLARRLFVSYRRKESRAVAIQLYEHFDQCGFDVFLDTHSIRPGESFQDELWHRLVDTDIVVLLNTPDFLGSFWTTEELAKASAMSIGILQLVWPTHKPIPTAALCPPLYLSDGNFEGKIYGMPNSHLTEDSIEEITSQVESLRARSLAARQDNLIKEFMVSAKSLKVSAVLHPEKFITAIRSDGKEVAVIPTVGVPQAFTYNQTEELIKRIRAHKAPEAFLLFDQRNIREKWQMHLSWLDNYLPVKSVKITDIEDWLKKL